MRRIVISLAAAMIVIVAALPAAAACCVMKTASATSMHAAMPCCGESCGITKANDRRDTDVTVTPATPLAVIASPSVIQSVAIARDAIAIPLSDPASPPIFLLDRQLRI